jgi:hypothetical protein
MWTYTGSPQINPIDLVHFRLGDTDPDNPIATDSECAQALADNGNNSWLAAATLAETKAAQLMRAPVTVRRGERGSGHTTQYSDPATWFLTLARTLRMNASIRTSTAYAGGLDVGEKESARRDQSLVQPFARKDLHTRPVWPNWETEEREP